MADVSTESYSLSINDVTSIVQTLLAALSKEGLTACLVGSAAMMLLGAQGRTPKDVDIFVLNARPGQDPEEIKATLVAHNPETFFLVDSRTPNATHRVLWQNVHPKYTERETKRSTRNGLMTKTPKGVPSLPTNQWATRVADARAQRSKSVTTGRPKFMEGSQLCKVDILLPGILGFPVIPSSGLCFHPSLTFPSCVSRNDDTSEDVTSRAEMPEEAVPYVCYILLVILKLKAWNDHTAPTATPKMQSHVAVDEDDIESLLRMGEDRLSWDELGWPEGFDGWTTNNQLSRNPWMLGGFADEEELNRCITKYSKRWPGTKDGWRRIGLL